jgi:hypothetical protein
MMAIKPSGQKKRRGKHLGDPMSERLIQNLYELSDNIETHVPSKKDCGAATADRPARTDAVKVSVGKYYSALKRLANE